MLSLILTIETVIALVQRTLTTAKAVAASVNEGKTVVLGPRNAPMTADDVVDAVERAQAAWADAGDNAAARIDTRND